MTEDQQLNLRRFFIELRKMLDGALSDDEALSSENREWAATVRKEAIGELHWKEFIAAQMVMIERWLKLVRALEFE
jgi:hypothetical protein